ncbi:MAG: hypothetical protein AB8B95_01935 [Pseudohongiellaceae bacterium]
MAEKYDVPYMERTRDYYRAQGYQSDYQWAQHTEAPFSPLGRPLSSSKIAVITTAMPDSYEGKSRRAVYSTPICPIPAALYTEELSWHHSVTHTNDVPSFLPLEQLQDLVNEGKIGSITEDFHSLPTEYSQRTTIEQDGPEILKRCQEQQADVALLVPL